ncbi:MAG TPA: AAA family ATPase, partial [Ktedonobacterales bacterium]|nr:AAA family ATPase [Ktedonobacterales bacterium]
MAETPAAPAPAVALFTLGAPRIERDGALVHVDTRKAIALLAYLALTGQRHSRDSLATLLWPDEDQPHARGALRRTLSTLHAILPPEWLDASREAIALSAASRLWLDAAAFKAALAQRATHGHAATEVCPRCLKPLAQAATLYQDDFLAGFHLRESERFEDWQLFQRERLRRELAGALEALARGYTARRAFGVAIGYARRWLELDPLHEPAHRLLMKLYFWDGQRAAALRQYHVCAQALASELGVAPLEATVALYTAIKERRAPEPPEMTPVAIVAPTTPQVATDRTGAPETADVASAPPTPATTTAGASPSATDSTVTHPAAPDTTSLADEAQPSRAPRGAPRATGGELPFVGRAEELATLASAYDALHLAWAKRTDDGAPVSGRLLLVEGEAGIGKTRLANEFLANAQGQGAATLVVRCYEGEAGLAYAPITAALRLAYARGMAGHATAGDRTGGRSDEATPPWQSELARLLPEVARGRAAPAQAGTSGGRQMSPDIPVTNGVEQARFFEGLRQALLALCQPSGSGAAWAPTIICFDDIQWADSASLDWLAYLARRLDDYPLCLLLTARSAELAQLAPLRRLLADAERAGVATVVRLGRLRREDMQALAGVGGARSGVFLAPAVIERLYDETEGTPFLLVEYLAALGQGALKADAPEWRLPGGARNVLRARLNALGGTAWQLLTTAAVIGRSFDGEIARTVSGRGEDETVQALEELLAHSLIAEHHADATHDLYDFSHAQLRELVYDETNQARRRLLHRRIAEALAARARRRGAPAATGIVSVPGTVGATRANASAGQIARHYQLAGQDELAADYYIQAARYARDLYANAEALAHLRAALALGRADDPSLHEAIGDLLTIQGEYAEALHSYEAAIALLASATTAASATSATPSAPGNATTSAASLAVIERKLGGVYARRGEWNLAERHVRAALRALGGPAGDTDDAIDTPPLGAIGEAGNSPHVKSLRASLYADWSLLTHRQGN